MTNGDAAVIQKSALARIGDFFFFNRNWLSALVISLLLTLTRPVFPHGLHKFDVPIDILGLIMIFAGQGLRYAVIGLAYIQRGGKEGKVWADDLVTNGFFAHCRNPLYVGNILVYIGIFVVLNNPIAYLIAIPFVLLMYSSIVATEEAFLRSKFGQKYSDYCKRVPRWMIRLKGLGETTRSMTFRWSRVLSKEYSTTLTWLLAVLYIFARELAIQKELGFDHWQTDVLLAILVTSVIAWATIRHLKINRKLPPDD